VINGKKNHPIRMGLMTHRKFEVRPEQRSALLAYGFLRGRRYKQLEAKCHTEPNWNRVRDLVAKYGSEQDRKMIADSLHLWRGN
jgi:hypothetical protein